MSLLSQTLTEWAANANGEFEWLPVCFDPTVQGRRGETEDEWVASTSDLGFPVTTDPDTIAAFLRRRERMVVFSTYQSSTQIAEANRQGRVPRFDRASPRPSAYGGSDGE